MGEPAEQDVAVVNGAAGSHASSMERSAEFEALLETIVGLAAANIVIIETLHEHRVLDKRHFAHAYARAIDTLSPELRGGMLERTLHDMRDRCMNIRSGATPPMGEWLARLQQGD